MVSWSYSALIQQSIQFLNDIQQPDYKYIPIQAATLKRSSGTAFGIIKVVLQESISEYC